MSRTVRPRSSAPGTSQRTWRRKICTIAALSLGFSVLAGCAAGQIAQSVDQISGVDGAQGTVGQIGIHNALFATPDGPKYPKGSEAPLTLWLTNNDYSSDTLTAITTDAGKVTISGDATIEPKSYLPVGGPDAKVTATVNDLTHDLSFGISVPMTFSFAHAGDISLNVPIENPHERVTPRATTNNYPQEPPNLWETVQTTPTNLTSPSVAVTSP